MRWNAFGKKNDVLKIKESLSREEKVSYGPLSVLHPTLWLGTFALRNGLSCGRPTHRTLNLLCKIWADVVRLDTEQPIRFKRQIPQVSRPLWNIFSSLLVSLIPFFSELVEIPESVSCSSAPNCVVSRTGLKHWFLFCSPPIILLTPES